MKPETALLKTLFPSACHDRIFMVGGMARDFLLAREWKDMDLVAALAAEELHSLGFRLVESSSGADIFFRHHPDFGRMEVSRIHEPEQLEEELRRRDFTINAIAMTLEGASIDPLNGAQDLCAGLLRPCSSSTFVNDPLRIFRAFRFECEGWLMTPETVGLVRRQGWSACFSAMPVERFSNEMLKALAAEKPERFFERMVEFSAGAEFLPELFRMPQIPAGPREYHPEGDLLTHSLQVLQKTAAWCDDPLARFCAFFHDLGKLATDPACYPRHHGHDDAGFRMAEPFCNRLRLPGSYGKALAWVNRLHSKANRWDELRGSTKIRMAEHAVKAGIAVILPLVSFADKPGSAPLKCWDSAVRVARMNSRELGIDREKIEAMPVADLPSFILQKRIEFLKREEAHVPDH